MDDESLTGLPGTVCMINDILVHGALHYQRVEAVLERLLSLEMTLNV